MRKWNAIISVLVIVLLLIHAIAGGYQLLGVLPGGRTWLKASSWCMMVLLLAHVVLGVCLTVKTLRACKKSGASYVRENKLFWARRISGFAMILFIAFHVVILTGMKGEAYRLRPFGMLQLAGSLLLVVSVAVHILSNIKPLLIAFGAKGVGAFIRDMLFVLSVVLLFCGVAFVIYFLRWNVLWR